MAKEDRLVLGKDTRKCQPRLRMIANANPVVNAVRSEQCPSIAVTNQTLLDKISIQRGDEAVPEPVPARQAQATKAPHPHPPIPLAHAGAPSGAAVSKKERDSRTARAPARGNTALTRDLMKTSTSARGEAGGDEQTGADSRGSRADRS